MSTEALAEIITVLRKYPSISTKVLLETTKQGILWTTISLRQSTGIQPSSSEKSSSRNSSKNPKKKIRKSPCRILRDKKRQEAYLSRKAGSLNKYTPPDPTLPRPPDPIISRLLPLDHQTTSESPTTPQPPDPTTQAYRTINVHHIPHMGTSSVQTKMCHACHPKMGMFIFYAIKT